VAEEATYEDGSPMYRFLAEGELTPLLVNDSERLPMAAREPEPLPEWQTIAEGDLESHVLSGKNVLITGCPAPERHIGREISLRGCAQREKTSRSFRRLTRALQTWEQTRERPTTLRDGSSETGRLVATFYLSRR